jgi:hypothetical protein
MNLCTMESTGKPRSNGSRAPFTEAGALRLFVRGDSMFSNWRDSVTVLASRVAPRSSIPTSYFLRGANVARVRFAGRSFGASFVLHLSLLAVLIYLPQAIPAKALPLSSTQLHFEKIYYRVPPLDPARMPQLSPAGPGGRPGSGSIPDRLPALGSTAPHPNMTIVSHPAHPDNFRQTIYQRSSPPDLRIPVELKLPNIVLGNPSEAPKPLMKVDPSTAKPMLTNRQIAPEAAPTVVAEAPKSPLTTYLDPSSSQPRLAIPLASAAKPTIKTGNGGPTGAAGGGVAEPGDGADLLVVGVDPAPAGSVVALGPGNRWGEFSISPAGGQPGSPGGVPGGVVGGGTGGNGAGGDGSTGVGSGGGGGGGKAGTPGPVSISGAGASGATGGGALDPATLISMVYPVTSPSINVRKNALVISAGPIGGGGLNVYGALNCGKIYSIFLPMPVKSWSMQYCDKSASSPKVSSESRTTMVQLDSPLLPPDFDPDHRFDFKRLPVPIEKSHRAIVLKGVLAVDGTVQHLVVYQGVLPEMDEAARIAFGRWRFKPAMRDGKPVEVEILVGIPPRAGEDRVNR